MLEVKNLTKIYSGKGGVTVRALDDVSVVFPETGMVFLLGKSGSGKSTLLNVAGGLDKPDGGEIIVKGKSSKEFTGSDFDSYRNTFIGFVFQEYNILNEFTIEQNIALALQLQNKPNDKAAVNALLEQVDLAGYGKRKPNTLSGGQKQRVAIARALIKEPEIIMADEPTGALDSATGKQVLDTLKKLSEKKLVIVVSHDVEFAETYGDRIIELKDGKIISDVSKVYSAPKAMEGEENTSAEAPNVAMVSDDTITIRNTEELTDADIGKIANLLRKKGGEAIITADSRELPNVKRVCKINENGSKESFKETVPPVPEQYDGSKTKFIKSRLPLGHAIKMGASGLKSKPIRLIFTILLSVATFILFGLVSTFMLYDADYSISEALKEANYPSIRVNKAYTGTRNSYQIDPNTGAKSLEYTSKMSEDTLFGASEADSRSRAGLDFAGIYYLSSNNYVDGIGLYLETSDGIIPIGVKNEVSKYYVVSNATGYCDCGESYLKRCGFSILAGKYPDRNDEIMLPEYLAELFVNTESFGITRVQDLVGREIRLSGSGMETSMSFKVVGIVRTGEIPYEFEEVKSNIQSISPVELEKIQHKLQDYFGKGYFSLLYVHTSFYERFKDNIQSYYYINIPTQNYEFLRVSNYTISDSEKEDILNYSNYSYFTEKSIESYLNIFKCYDLSGNPVSKNPGYGEAYVSKNLYADMVRGQLSNYLYSIENNMRYDPNAREELGMDSSDQTEFRNNYYNYDFRSIKVMKGYVEKYYSDLAYKNWLYRAAESLMNYYTYDKYGNSYYEYASNEKFSSAFYAVQNYAYGGKDATYSAPTKKQWEDIETVVLRDFKKKREQVYYGLLLDSFFNTYERFGETIFNYTWSLINNSYSDQDYAQVKKEVDAALAKIGKSAKDDIKSYFVFDATDFGTKLYYYGIGSPSSGTMKVVGYFDYGVEYPSASYFVSTEFLDANAKKVVYDYPIWTEEIVTTYVVPADAKYNALISPTNNSLDQISAALFESTSATYSIDNSVCEDIRMFVDMIEDLEKIFLYVGLGVGLLAAFFLLNFISVSIAAKRKDIGILRAVGARGSDVFKIFYAEAFLIAFICFIIASIGSFILCAVLNNTISETIHLRLLHFGAINIALIFGIAIFVSVIATFLPVYFAARKSPVESIRAL